MPLLATPPRVGPKTLANPQPTGVGKGGSRGRKPPGFGICLCHRFGYNQTKPMGELTVFGRRIYYFRTTTSTQDEARRLAEGGAPEGTIVLAEEQTAGRGRLGRTWISPPGSSILMSIIFRPPLLPHQAHRLTMVTSLSIAEAIENLTPLKVAIKWPNDILLAGKKAGGILTEIQTSADRILYAIVGVGLNVNVKISESPLSTLAPYATSLSDELGYEFPRFILLQEIISCLEGNYQELKKGADFRAKWQARLHPLGREVTVITPTETIEGVAIGVNEDGALLLATHEGEVKTIWAGDVTLKKEVGHEQKDNPRHRP